MPTPVRHSSPAENMTISRRSSDQYAAAEPVLVPPFIYRDENKGDRYQATLLFIHLLVISHHLEQVELQIIRLRDIPKDGMVGRLLTRLDLLELHLRVAGRCKEHFDELLLRHKV